MKRVVSPRQVAQAIGVSEASLKRWCDKGLISATRTAGGHRRLPIHEVLHFIRSKGYVIREPAVLGLPPALGNSDNHRDALARDLAEALIEGNEPASRQRVFNAYLGEWDIASICDQLIAPALHDIGQRWQAGDLHVYEERRAVQICSRILFELQIAVSPPKPDAPIAIGAALEHDPYTLPTGMAALTLIDSGWQAWSYGSGLPADTLNTALKEVRPQLFWTSVSRIDSLSEFVHDMKLLYKTAQSHRCAMVVGGRALTPEVRQQIRYSCYCDSMGDLASFAQTLFCHTSDS